MAIEVWPDTKGAAHTGFVDDDGRRYIMDHAKRPEFDGLASGIAPDPALVNPGEFYADDARDYPLLCVLRVESKQAGSGCIIHVGVRRHKEGGCEGDEPSGLVLTKREIATLAAHMGAR